MLKELNSSELIIVSGGFGFQPGGRHTTAENGAEEDRNAYRDLHTAGHGGGTKRLIKAGKKWIRKKRKKRRRR